MFYRNQQDRQDMTINISISSLPWAKAELLEMTVDRRHPGRRDEVQFRMKWPDESKSTVVFAGCHALLTQMNFGVECTEEIASVETLDDEPGLTQLKARAQAAGKPTDKLRCYRIKTASTGSILRIYAEETRVL